MIQSASFKSLDSVTFVLISIFLVFVTGEVISTLLLLIPPSGAVST
jgi:hypothetical protein